MLIFPVVDAVTLLVPLIEEPLYEPWKMRSNHPGTSWNSAW